MRSPKGSIRGKKQKATKRNPLNPVLPKVILVRQTQEAQAIQVKEATKREPKGNTRGKKQKARKRIRLNHEGPKVNNDTDLPKRDTTIEKSLILANPVVLVKMAK